MKIILFEPQIPQNTGNIVRTCSVTKNSLILVEPLGFKINNRWLKRAGLDYWEGVPVEVISDLNHYLMKTTETFWFFSSKANTLYTAPTYTNQDLLIFGSETHGISEKFWKQWPDRFLKIPMYPNSRCLNLSVSVGIVVYETWRQLNFENLNEAK